MWKNARAYIHRLSAYYTKPTHNLRQPTENILYTHWLNSLIMFRFVCVAVCTVCNIQRNPLLCSRMYRSDIFTEFD